MMKNSRLFVSLDLPSEWQNYLVLVQQHLKDQQFFEGTFVDLSLLHVTLQFIGEVGDKKLAEIQRALAHVKAERFEICLGELEVFECNNDIRIIWINVLGEEINNLAQTINQAVTPIVELENRSFVPHSTLVRVKKVYDRTALLDYLRSMTIKPLCCTVSEFYLKESIVVNNKRTYKTRVTFKLK